MKALVFFLILLALNGCATSRELPASKINYYSISDVQWEKLNPARGKKSPQAATLWGDRKKNRASGFLVKFVNGFSSPPHIHNVSYRGVVIDGLIHNDDPKAAKMWMPVSSYWTQPKGEPHITAAQGSSNIAYIEIEGGPYLVKPVSESFDSGERPINVDPSNLVWHKQKGAQVSYLWGERDYGKINGTLIRMLSGHRKTLVSRGEEIQIVLIRGVININGKDLTPGSYISIGKKAALKIVVAPQSKEAIFYVRTKGKYDLK